MIPEKRKDPAVICPECDGWPNDQEPPCEACQQYGIVLTGNEDAARLQYLKGRMIKRESHRERNKATRDKHKIVTNANQAMKAVSDGFITDETIAKLRQIASQVAEIATMEHGEARLKVRASKTLVEMLQLLRTEASDPTQAKAGTGPISVNISVTPQTEARVLDVEIREPLDELDEAS